MAAENSPTTPCSPLANTKPNTAVTVFPPFPICPALSRVPPKVAPLISPAVPSRLRAHRNAVRLKPASTGRTSHNAALCVRSGCLWPHPRPSPPPWTPRPRHKQPSHVRPFRHTLKLEHKVLCSLGTAPLATLCAFRPSRGGHVGRAGNRLRPFRSSHGFRPSKESPSAISFIEPTPRPLLPAAPRAVLLHPEISGHKSPTCLIQRRI